MIDKEKLAYFIADYMNNHVDALETIARFLATGGANRCAEHVLTRLKSDK